MVILEPALIPNAASLGILLKKVKPFLNKPSILALGDNISAAVLAAFFAPPFLNTLNASSIAFPPSIFKLLRLKILFPIIFPIVPALLELSSTA